MEKRDQFMESLTSYNVQVKGLFWIGQGLPISFPLWWEGKMDVGKFTGRIVGSSLFPHIDTSKKCTVRALSRDDILSTSVMIIKQERSVSRAQSPPVPARKNQLRAEGRVNY